MTSHAFGFYIDGLAVTVFVLVAALLAVVLQFSRRYMAGEPRQRQFTIWLCLTGMSVLGLTVSGTLLQFALFWSATSLCLHRLLVFYPDRLGAQLAARKKFIISRAGDACLLIALVLVYREFGTWEFGALFAAAERMSASGVAPSNSSQAIGLLLVSGAMLKSAQFPFHSWLPDTMETPTPVSALMHAGIINAGGFLILRMSPLVTLSPWALTALATVGGFTALFGAVVMLTQSSVKRGLAFSTVAQMGFMMFECGLGAFGLALLHLVAHAIYKAHAFLSSGSAVGAANASVQRTAVPVATAVTAAIAAIVSMSAGATLIGADLTASIGTFMLAGIFTTATASFVANLWRAQVTPTRAAAGFGAAAVLSTIYVGLHRLFDATVPSVSRAPEPHLDAASAVAVTAVLVLLFVLDAWVPTALERPRLRALYVHARNGFYLNTLANRLVAILWPLKPLAVETRR